VHVRVDKAGEQNVIAEIVQARDGRHFVPPTDARDAFAIYQESGGGESLGREHAGGTERVCHTVFTFAAGGGVEQVNAGSAPNPEFLRRAIALATENVLAAKGGPFGAVIVRDGRIVGEGANSVTATSDPTAHAEVNAIRDACRALGTFVLAGCQLYTSCEPCPMCLSAIYWARISHIYYANDRHDAARIGFRDDFLYREISLPLAQRAVPTQPLLREEGKAAFDEWHRKPDKIEY
jgi:tRNA(Arg) A34 adenosine deaminase TadA